MTELDVWSIDARTGEKAGAVAVAATETDVNTSAERAALVASALVSSGLVGRARLLRAMADEVEKDGDTTRCWARLERLLEDALIKISAVASSIATQSPLRRDRAQDRDTGGASRSLVARRA